MPLCVSAASLIPAKLGGQVQQFVAGGKVSGCGISFHGIEKSQFGRLFVFTGSMVLFRSGYAVVKGGVSEADASILYSSAFNLRDLKPLNTINVWMKAPNNTATVPVDGIAESEDKKHITYISKFESAFPVLRAVLDGKNIQIGFRIDGKTTEQVMFGTVEISPEENDQLSECFQELSR